MKELNVSGTLRDVEWGQDSTPILGQTRRRFTRSVFERYNIVTEGDQADAARKLDRLAGPIPGTKSPDEPHTAPPAEAK